MGSNFQESKLDSRALWRGIRKDAEADLGYRYIHNQPFFVHRQTLEDFSEVEGGEEKCKVGFLRYFTKPILSSEEKTSLL